MSYLERDGRQIYYEVSGGPVPGRALPLVLSHGYGASAAMWEPNPGGPRRRPPGPSPWDMRGHGRSGSPDDPAEYSEAATGGRPGGPGWTARASTGP